MCACYVVILYFTELTNNDVNYTAKRILCLIELQLPRPNPFITEFLPSCIASYYPEIISKYEYKNVMLICAGQLKTYSLKPSWCCCANEQLTCIVVKYSATGIYKVCRIAPPTIYSVYNIILAILYGPLFT